MFRWKLDYRRKELPAGYGKVDGAVVEKRNAPHAQDGLGLSAYHGWMVGYSKKLAAGERPLEGKKLRILNEVPGIAAAIIVILVVAKPF